MASVLEAFGGFPTIVGVCWQQTSCAETLWLVRETEDEDRWFDWSRDAESHGAWLLFGQYDEPRN